MIWNEREQVHTMATKIKLLAHGFERVSEGIIPDWFEARYQASAFWQQGRSAMLVKEVGGWAIYALPVSPLDAVKERVAG
jgi:hypothetical protein